MELRARIRHFARPAALSAAALSALLVPAIAGPATAAAKSKRYPVVTSVRPMNPKVGDTIVIRGRNFNRGKNKNTVVFKRDGQRAVFQKLTLATAKQIRVVVPDSLRPFLADNTSARFRLRILSKRFSKKYTSASASPVITALPKPTGSGTTVNGGTIVTPNAPSTPATPAKVCRGDEDGDLLDAALENSLGLDACNADSDGDGVPDGYEYQSARDLNDDEYQESNQSLPFPGERPYPNPLFKDADVDYDGDGLPLASEYRLWKAYGAPPSGLLPSESYRLYYSDGEQYSLSARQGGTGRRTPTQPAATYAKAAEFLAWASANGYNPILISKAAPWYDPANKQSFDIRDVNQDHTVSAPESSLADLDGDGFISDDERDEDADGLSNIDELRRAMQPAYWSECYKAIKEIPYPIVYAGTDLVDADTDGDGVRDGADDQDHDDIPNVMELSRAAASGFQDWHPRKGKCFVEDTLLNGPDIDGDGQADPVVLHADSAYGRVNPFNPCLPYKWSRTCPSGAAFGTTFAPYDNSPWYSLQ